MRFSLLIALALGVQSCEDDNTKAVVNAYVASAKAGRATPLHADADSEACTATLARSQKLEVRSGTVDWKDGTACYWTTATADGKETKIAFLLERDRQKSDWKVARVSSTKNCHCRRGFPCGMDP